MTFSAKVVSDLLGVAQGYRDHIGLCDALIAEGSTVLLGDGLAPAESKAAHETYVTEFNNFFASIGVDVPNASAAEHGIKSAEDVANEIIQALDPESGARALEQLKAEYTKGAP